MSVHAFALALTAAPALALIWRYRAALAAWSWLDRLGGGLLLAALFTAWALALTAIAGAPVTDWNGARLAPTFALLYGYDLYYPAAEGPITNHVYGPVAALAYLPATIFRTPTPAILAGATLQVLFVFGGMLAFVWRAGVRTAADIPLALACGLGACLFLSRYPGTAYWFTMVHADGPSLALGLLACAALIARDGAPSDRALLASAVAAVLSCWAKQTAAPLPIALVVAVGLAHGGRLALRYAAIVAAIGLALSGLCLAWFGRPMLFNMLEIVSRHAWVKPGIGGLAAVAARFLASMWEIFALLAIGLGLARFTGSSGRAWWPPLVAAVCLLPTGALGANKLGGEPSSFHSAYYLLAAVAALFVDTGRRRETARIAGWSFVVLAIVAAWQSGRCTPPPDRPPVWHNSNQLAYEFARAHPGEAYFPWQPLAVLLAEGRLYHFEYGIIDRFLAGYEPTPEHFRAHVPQDMRWIAGHARLWTMNHFFPDYREEVQVEELPGFVVREKPTKNFTRRHGATESAGNRESEVGAVDSIVDDLCSSSTVPLQLRILRASVPPCEDFSSDQVR